MIKNTPLLLKDNITEISSYLKDPMVKYERLSLVFFEI